MRDANPTAIYLKDYAPPDYLIDAIELDIHLAADSTRVHTCLTLRRNPASQSQAPALHLNGENLTLHSVTLDNQAIDDYQQTDTHLTLTQVPQQRDFQVQIVNSISPQANTALEGLYLSKDMLCTQCEAEGFRKITYFLDRPDVMSRFRTRLVADAQRYPVLLSNGNLLDSGELNDGRHFALWEDPFPKPCYLFAVVAGPLACIEDQYRTCSGREVTLKIFVESKDLDKCAHAMASLQRAMRWDERVFGREYDLDLYMIVAVGHFNMGAMENKGLNIFNTQYVLARPDTATDDDYEHIEGVIGHEYFHNWSGNRVTCRDWFQLSLKEGFTVFRDQQFTADMTSHAVKRIDDVNRLRAMQFAEDQSPMAHPVRPEAYIEINNFYTVTVYEKGAELVRMLHTLLGATGFRKGCDLYFQRHDGQAVTCDDFVNALADANQYDLTPFKRWYAQAGTPVVSVNSDYDAAQQRLTLTLSQNTPATPDQKVKQPVPIPIQTGLLSQASGAPLNTVLKGHSAPQQQWLLILQQAEQQFVFEQVTEPPVLSLLRGFSAPVKLNYPRQPETWAFLLRHDTDPFNRWEAGQTLFIESVLGELDSGQNTPASTLWLDSMTALLEQEFTDLAYWAQLLTPPSETYLAELMPVVDVDGLHRIREARLTALAEHGQDGLLRLYQRYHQDADTARDAPAIGRRRLANICLQLLARLNQPEYAALATRHYQNAGNMTDQLAALTALVHHRLTGWEQALAHFQQTWRHEALVMDKWFRVQATSPQPETLATVTGLLTHADFDLGTPNRTRALLGAFSQANPSVFHSPDGQGYALLADHIMKLNRLNPQIAARLLKPLSQWQRYDASRQALMRQALSRILAEPDLSADVYEIVNKSLAHQSA
ncbi:MAG: aminopeptidase N [Methylococcales bacterium]|nr:aminopeptidase N [Methylococcales bacterium]